MLGPDSCSRNDRAELLRRHDFGPHSLREDVVEALVLEYSTRIHDFPAATEISSLFVEPRPQNVPEVSPFRIDLIHGWNCGSGKADLACRIDFGIIFHLKPRRLPCNLVVELWISQELCAYRSVKLFWDPLLRDAFLKANNSRLRHSS